MDTLDTLQDIVSRIDMTVFGKTFNVIYKRDIKRPDTGRIFIQIVYTDKCRKTGKEQLWKSRKYYISEHMTEDELVKTIYVAFEQCVKHEIMEGFCIDNKVLFNPHVHYTELLAISDREIAREERELTYDDLPKGTKVTYKPTGEQGLVKSHSTHKAVFVVYACAGNWDKYEDYTSQRTNISDLRLGWE